MPLPRLKACGLAGRPPGAGRAREPDESPDKAPDLRRPRVLRPDGEEPPPARASVQSRRLQ